MIPVMLCARLLGQFIVYQIDGHLYDPCNIVYQIDGHQYDPRNVMC